MATGTATIEVLFFARIAEDLGIRHKTQALPAPIQIHDWLIELKQQYPQLESIAGLKIAVNQEYAGPTDLIRPGDEVALFEPVTGG
ncbi:MAG TPA: MoaD/ThiS family protein [Castellaniella sp.]|uniref:MoaD/ThiS family protein n=1 Tax=Castellaniella sp. TaxID=1955812 RepID=UPI002F1D57C4